LHKPVSELLDEHERHVGSAAIQVDGPVYVQGGLLVLVANSSHAIELGQRQVQDTDLALCADIQAPSNWGGER
jgi:hypothetical protein